MDSTSDITPLGLKVLANRHLLCIYYARYCAVHVCSDAVVSESCSCVDIDSARQTFGLMQARLKGTDFENRVRE